MTELEDMIYEIEQHEDNVDMHFSLYSIPEYYQEEDE